MSATICRSPDGESPCPYSANCGGLRQIVQHNAGKRGETCEFFVGFRELDEDDGA